METNAVSSSILSVLCEGHSLDIAITRKGLVYCETHYNQGRDGLFECDTHLCELELHSYVQREPGETCTAKYTWLFNFLFVKSMHTQRKVVK